MKRVLRSGIHKCFAAAVAVSFVVTAASAEQAVVIANYAYDDSTPQSDVRARALDVSETLFGLGYTVNRLENPDADEITAALDALSSVDGPVVIYYAGRTEVDGTQTRVMLSDITSSVAFDDMLVRAGVGSRSATMVFLDVCPKAEPTVEIEQEPTDDTASVDQIDLPQIEPEIIPALGPLPELDGLFVASSIPVGAACASFEETLTDVMLERLLVPGLDIDTLFDDTSVATASSLTAPFVFRTADNGMRLTAEDYRMLDSLSPEAQEQMLALWAAAGIVVDRAGTTRPAAAPTRVISTETVVLTSPVKPISGGVTLVPVTPNVSRVQDGISLTPRQTTPIQASAAARPVPGAGGLPQPSIIVGLPEPTEASFATATEPTGPVSGAAVEFADAAERRALRDSDPEFFASLLEAGAFDPPPAELIVALQTELAAMNCYTSRIDGAWGPGSRASVGRYYEQLGTAAPSQDPDVSIFRQIALRDDVTCPVVQAAPARQTTTTRTTTRTTTTTTAPAATPAPAPTPEPAAPSRTMNRSTGSGIFR